ncbi:hypothetical protein Taro_006398, partial [Colocasia esculenta]|nr:hypothetical protein [Colocasia esculenta]
LRPPTRPASPLARSNRHRALAHDSGDDLPTHAAGGLHSLRSSLHPDAGGLLRELPFCGADHGLPSSAEGTDSVPHGLLFNVFHASASLRPEFEGLVAEDIPREDGCPPLCIIADVFMGLPGLPWASGSGADSKAQSVDFAVLHLNAKYVLSCDQVAHHVFLIDICEKGGKGIANLNSQMEMGMFTLLKGAHFISDACMRLGVTPPSFSSTFKIVLKSPATSHGPWIWEYKAFILSSHKCYVLF